MAGFGFRCAAVAVVMTVTAALSSSCAGSAPQPAPFRPSRTADGASPRTGTGATTGRPTPNASPNASASAVPIPSGGIDRDLYDATVDFYAALSSSYATLDPGPVQAQMVRGSQAAAEDIAAIQRARQRQHRFAQIPTYLVSNLRVVPSSSKLTRVVTFDLATSAMSEADNGGTTVRDWPATDTSVRITLQHRSSRWLVLTRENA